MGGAKGGVRGHSEDEVNLDVRRNVLEHGTEETLPSWFARVRICLDSPLPLVHRVPRAEVLILSCSKAFWVQEPRSAAPEQAPSNRYGR